VTSKGGVGFVAFFGFLCFRLNERPDLMRRNVPPPIEPRASCTRLERVIRAMTNLSRKKEPLVGGHGRRGGDEVRAAEKGHAVMS
jgi:hypothetical protein